MADSTVLPSFLNQHNQTHPIPKLEDFLGDSSSIVHSQTETPDSSLTQIYEHHPHNQSSAYFTEHQDLKAITGFQAFSNNSGSEVDDSASIGKATPQLGGGHSIESPGNELGFSNCTPASDTLSLAVNNSNANTNQRTNDKSIVVADSDKKVADTFGQRTSIYRGVTRYF